MENQQQQQDRKPWEVVKSIERGGVTLRVKKLDLFHPRYSLEIGTEDEALGRLRPFFNLDMRVAEGVVKFRSIARTTCAR